MKALTKIVAGGVAAAALFSAAPAAAQYYPGPYGYGNGGNVVGQVINQVLGGGAYGGYGGYGGANSQAVISQCTNAVQARLSGGYAGGYGGYGGGYGYNGYGGGRVLGISRVEQRSGGGLTVRGVATSGRYAGVGYGYNSQPPVDLTFKCKTDASGYIVDIDIEQATSAYGNGYNGQIYSPYSRDYSQYGYRRY